jgi:hypothetical protein
MEALDLAKFQVGQLHGWPIQSWQYKIFTIIEGGKFIDFYQNLRLVKFQLNQNLFGQIFVWPNLSLAE